MADGIPSIELPDLTSPLPGREREQHVLHVLVNQCLQGHGSVVLISGEAGIGKTTLCDRLTRQALKSGLVALTGQCYDLTSGQPFTPWRDVLTSLSSTFPSVSCPSLSRQQDGSTSPGSRTELFESVTNAFRTSSGEAPVLVILEDIHWADTASLELLRYVSRLVTGLPLLLVATYRDTEPDTSGTLSAMLPDIVRESRAERLEPGRLSPQDVHWFVQSGFGDEVEPHVVETLANYLHERAEGNPFFMTELFRDVNRGDWLSMQANNSPDMLLREMPVPSLVRHVIENRVRQLSEKAQSLLAAAAVIGQDVPINLWQSVTNADDQELGNAIEEAIDWHLLRESGDGERVQFIHGLVQETLYLGQIALRRRALHRRIAECLAAQPNPAPEMIAHHFELAGDERAIECLIQAADRARQMYAADDAIRSIERAERLAERAGKELPLEALRIRAVSRELMGDGDGARVNYEHLLERARASGDRHTEWRALLDLGMLWTGMDYQQAGIFFNKAYDLARSLDDQTIVAHSINRIANWKVNIGQTGLVDIIAMHQEALSIFEAVGDRTGIADTLDLLGMTCYLAGEFSLSAEYERRAIALSREMGDKARLLTSLTALAVNGGDLDVSFDAGVAASNDPGFWVGCAEEALAISRETGWKSDQAFTLTMLASLVSVRGDPGRGLRLATEAQEIATSIGHQQWISASALVLGRTWSELLDYRRGEYYLERCRATSKSIASYFWTVFANSALANLHTEAGHVDLAGTFLKPFLSTEGTGKSNSQRSFQLYLGVWKLAAGEAEEALRIADALIALEEGSPLIKGVPQVLKLRADALSQLDRLSEARQAYDDALEAAQLLGYRSVLWKIYAGYGALLLKLGQDSSAKDAFGLAENAADEIAKTIDNRATRAEFLTNVRKRIETTTRATDDQTSTGGLSARQLEVLSLVALGLTDAQVADRLYISPRTVARHLQSIYDRLGVNSRTAAVTIAYQRNLIRPSATP